MYTKYFLFSLIVSILITKFTETVSTRVPRDYAEPVSVTRTGVTRGIPISTNNQTLGSANISAPIPLSRQSEESDEEWEPLLCKQCLNDRYLGHYHARGCKQINHQLICKKPCPQYFDCPKKDSDRVVEGCEYKGKVYKYREKIEMENPCKIGCFCDKYKDLKNITHSDITCAAIDCPPTNLLPNCYPIYEDSKCCPQVKCPTAQEVANQQKCVYNGNEVFFGQTIYPKEDPCLECRCDQNWNPNNPVKSTGCKKINCEIKADREGCIPIYHEKVCCPIEYFCPPQEEHQCKFNGKTYLIGERLPIQRERTECTCLIPPDFTCIEKSREEIPQKPDYIKKFQTLPTIKITNSSSDPFANVRPLVADSKCPPFIAGGLTCAGVNCTTIIDQDGCQACKCQQECPQLKCRKGCTLFVTTPGVCPKCNCP